MSTPGALDPAQALNTQTEMYYGAALKEIEKYMQHQQESALLENLRGKNFTINLKRIETNSGKKINYKLEIVKVDTGESKTWQIPPSKIADAIAAGKSLIATAMIFQPESFSYLASDIIGVHAQLEAIELTTGLTIPGGFPSVKGGTP